MRVLFLYASPFGSTMAPLGVAYLSAVLKAAGHDTRVFATAFYATGKNANKAKEAAGTVDRKTDYSSFDAQVKPESALWGDWRMVIEEYGPDLIAISSVEDSAGVALSLAMGVRDIPVVMGGPFATFASRLALEHGGVDVLCIGEGEDGLTNICEEIVGGTWAAGTFTSALSDINTLPMPDFDVFPEAMLYRPMQGQMRRTLALEVQRGCPFGCAYCNSKAQKDLAGPGFYRRKSAKRIGKELVYLAPRHKPEFIYMVGDSFLSMPEKEWKAFCEMYEQYKIPFWMNTRPESVTPQRATDLDELGCIRCNIGIEHGNEQYRREVLHRHVSDQQILDAVGSFRDTSIHLVVNAIIGFPFETRELLDDTVRLVRFAEHWDSASAFLYTPYHGTELRPKAVEAGMVGEDEIVTDGLLTAYDTGGGVTAGELYDLQRTFSERVKPCPL